MSLRACESCDLISSAQLQGGTGRWGVLGTATLATVVAGRNGNGFRTVTSGTTQFVHIFRDFDNQPTWILGFAFNLASLDPGPSDMRVAGIADTTTDQVTLWLRQVDRRLELRRGATVLATVAAPLALNSYNYIEFKATIHSSTGLAEVRVNQVVAATFSGNTRSTANNYANRIDLGMVTGKGSGVSNEQVATYDDIYINDGTGTTNNDYIGDVLVKALVPTGAGASTQWTPSAGANWAAVDDTPANEDSDYVSSATVGQIDTYAYSDLAANVNTVKAVIAVNRMRKDDAGGRTMKAIARPSGTNFEGADTAITQTYAYYENIWETNPATGAQWTPAEVNAAEFGVKVQS